MHNVTLQRICITAVATGNEQVPSVLLLNYM